MLKDKCDICSNEPPKYKCPTCEINYCSINCYKKHKEEPCEPKINTEDAPPTLEHPPTRFQTRDSVDPSKLELLKNSEPLKDILKNRHLRNLLVEVDSAADASKAIDAAMKEPIFLEFADEVLKVIDVE